MPSNEQLCLSSLSWDNSSGLRACPCHYSQSLFSGAGLLKPTIIYQYHTIFLDSLDHEEECGPHRRTLSQSKTPGGVDPLPLQPSNSASVGVHDMAVYSFSPRRYALSTTISHTSPKLLRCNLSLAIPQFRCQKSTVPSHVKSGHTS